MSEKITGAEQDVDALLVPDARFARFCSVLESREGEIQHLLESIVRYAMNEAGEDPDNPVLFALRCRQAAYGIDSRAQREWSRVASGASREPGA